MDEQHSEKPESGESATPAATTHEHPLAIVVQQHSMILYWWPVWVLGFVFAGMSFFMGEQVTVGGESMWFYPSRNIGVIFICVVAIVFVFTNVAVRGVGALIGALASLVLVLALSLLGIWDELFSLEQHLSIHMDGGFYLIVSALLSVAWFITIFLFDRFTHCEFRPGQLIVRNIIGGGSRTYDTRGMAFYKLQDDPLRHWLLGLGTGDLHIATTGAESITLDVRNVAFIDRKLQRIKELVAMSPDHLPES